MARYKKDNGHNYAKGECPKCGGQTTRRNSVASHPSEQDEHKIVRARDKGGKPVTRSALPRQHRKCPE